MIKKRIEVIVKVAAILYLIYLFCSSFSLPKYKSKTEFHTNTLDLIKELEHHTNWLKYGFKFHSNARANLPEHATLRQQLSFQFPYEPAKPFQKNIWQTWKVPIEHPSFPNKYKKYQATWDDKNPGYKHYVIPDESCEQLINQLYATVPDVARAYNIMPKSILKADFFRYLILYAKGGLYTDIDTISIKPIDTWVSMNETVDGSPNMAGLVVGIEADPDREDWADWYARRIQFCQWTIQAKRGHPMLRELISRITDITLTREKKGQLNKILGKDAGGDIMNWTGPGIWTDVVFEYMNNISQPPDNFKTKKYDDIINVSVFTGMTIPVAIQDVLVLPITSFSPDVGQMGAKDTSHPMAYAKHMFLGSWKPDDEKILNT